MSVFYIKYNVKKGADQELLLFNAEYSAVSDL